MVVFIEMSLVQNIEGEVVFFCLLMKESSDFCCGEDGSAVPLLKGLKELASDERDILVEESQSNYKQEGREMNRIFHAVQL